MEQLEPGENLNGLSGKTECGF